MQESPVLSFPLPSLASARLRKPSSMESMQSAGPRSFARRRMNAEEAIAELGQRTGRPEWSLDEEGLASLVFDSRLLVDFELLRGGRSLHLSSAVSHSGIESASALHALLRANLLGAATGGAWFSLGPDEEVLFERRLDLDGLDLSGFLHEVESYVNHLDAWEDRIAGDETEELGKVEAPALGEFRIEI